MKEDCRTKCDNLANISINGERVARTLTHTKKPTKMTTFTFSLFLSPVVPQMFFDYQNHQLADDDIILYLNYVLCLNDCFRSFFSPDKVVI